MRADALKVVLTISERDIGVFFGGRRRISAKSRGHVDHFPAKVYEAWGMDVEAACAELAVAKALNLYPTGLGQIDETGVDTDVGTDVAVKSSPRDDGCLIVKRGDPVACRYVLVLGRVPTFWLVGWYPGALAKSERFWREDVPSPAYFIPQGKLFPAHELREGGSWLTKPKGSGSITSRALTAIS